MNKLFYLSFLLWFIFEVANVYFIMPMPGSQETDSIALAYFLYSYRWLFRIAFFLGIVGGIRMVWKKKKWIPIALILILSVFIYITNGPLTASSMFEPISKKTMADSLRNQVPLNRLVLGVAINGDARAYPIQIVGYHHRIFDTVGGQPVMVTYCTVCRTGRVYNPVTEGRTEEFRLVGMDHYNAMFEDETTGSWWRQATGEYCAGKLKGQMIATIPNEQMTLGEWLKMYPGSKILQPDTLFAKEYYALSKYESGGSKSHLTKTDRTSWSEKSWVLGIQGKNRAYAYDWNALLRRKYLTDTLDGKTFIIFSGEDSLSFSAWYVPESLSEVRRSYYLNNGVLETGNYHYYRNGDAWYHHGNKPGSKLTPATIYQEYWHSWRTFHPNTQKRNGY